MALKKEWSIFLAGSLFPFYLMGAFCDVAGLGFVDTAKTLAVDALKCGCCEKTEVLTLACSVHWVPRSEFSMKNILITASVTFPKSPCFRAYVSCTDHLSLGFFLRKLLAKQSAHKFLGLQVKVPLLMRSFFSIASQFANFQDWWLIIFYRNIRCKSSFEVSPELPKGFLRWESFLKVASRQSF